MGWGSVTALWAKLVVQYRRTTSNPFFYVPSHTALPHCIIIKGVGGISGGLLVTRFYSIRVGSLWGSTGFDCNFACV